MFMDKGSEGLAKRFWAKVVKKSDPDCWLWTGCKDSNGYGRISVGGRSGKPELAHRISYTLSIGKIPSGLHIRHKCDNPSCVNPNHLEAGTHAENMADFNRRGHGNRGEKNGGSVLTPAEVKEIKSRLGRGESPSKICKSYSVCRSAIERIKNRNGWGHLQ